MKGNDWDADIDKGGYVDPKLDCPHCDTEIQSLTLQRAKEAFGEGCLTCKDTKENWICLTCHKVFCSRYVKAHMVAHNTAENHNIATSLQDLNTWCYKCQSYIMSHKERTTYDTLHLMKFGNLPNANLQVVDSSEKPKWTVEEKEESEEELLEKVKEISDLIKKSKNIVIFTGAGISTSAKIPDFRGPEGVWTLKAKGLTAEGIKLEQAAPTPCHMSIVALKNYCAENGKGFYLISQNIDGLHRRSGIERNSISELHGNSFMEICWKCNKEYLRTFDAAAVSGRGGTECKECLARVPKFCHCTERKCDCGAVLKDSIIHFGEDLPANDLKTAFSKSAEADLCIVLGSSLTVSPANKMPSETKKKGGKVVIVNLQTTHLDKQADVRLFAKTDWVFQKLAELLGLKVKEFKLENFFNEDK